MSVKRSKEEKAADLAQAMQQGLSDLVTRRLTSRQRPWVHDGKIYRMSWQDISAYTFGEVEAEVTSQLALVGITGAKFSRHGDGFALRIEIPEENFNAAALKPDGKHPLRIQEQVARGGR